MRITFMYRGNHGMEVETGYVVRRYRNGWLLISDHPRMMVNPRRHEMCHIRKMVMA